MQRRPNEYAHVRRYGDADAHALSLRTLGDVGVVVRHYAERFGLEQVAIAGYSMGGNLVLKLAGEWGNRPPLSAVAAVCPAIDLAPGADALHEPLNRVYEWRFLRGLMARYSRKAKLFPGSTLPGRPSGR